MDQWRAYACAVLYGFIAHNQGSPFFILYCGVLVIVFMLHSFSERRTCRQIDLLVQLVRELENKSNDNVASSKTGTQEDRP